MSFLRSSTRSMYRRQRHPVWDRTLGGQNPCCAGLTNQSQACKAKDCTMTVAGFPPTASDCKHMQQISELDEQDKGSKTDLPPSIATTVASLLYCQKGSFESFQRYNLNCRVINSIQVNAHQSSRAHSAVMSLGGPRSRYMHPLGPPPWWCSLSSTGRDPAPPLSAISDLFQRPGPWHIHDISELSISNILYIQVKILCVEDFLEHVSFPIQSLIKQEPSRRAPSGHKPLKFWR